MKEKLGLTLIVAVFSTLAFAADQQQSWKDLDVDQNGFISQGEASSTQDLIVKWNEYDANQDGQLDQDEFAQFEMESNGNTSESNSTKSTNQ
jgi:hypothetical protein